MKVERTLEAHSEELLKREKPASYAIEYFKAFHHISTEVPENLAEKNREETVWDSFLDYIMESKLKWKLVSNP